MKKNKIKGIILSGGLGTRLFPITKSLSKQLLPVYNKPMIYYPISTLMLAGIKDILIITTSDDIRNYKKLLGDGSQFGVNFKYKIQKKPRGISDAFIIGHEFIGNSHVCLILGDNIFYGNDLIKKLSLSVNNCFYNNLATIFCYSVQNPSDYGVCELTNKFYPKRIVEKPKLPKSNLAVTGLYFYPNDVLKKVKKIKPSKRGELEITSINNLYLKERRLSAQILSRGFAWLDMGSFDGLLDASNFVKTIETRQGMKIACLEEIAYRNKFINKKKLKTFLQKYKLREDKEYLTNIIKRNVY